MATKEPEGKMVVGENEPKAPRIELEYRTFNKKLEKQYLPAIRALIAKDLSEPYSIYVYRYFLYEWADLCWMAIHPETKELIGIVINKLEPHHSHSPATLRGYIGMLAVASTYRGQGIATKLVRLGIDSMIARDADEIVLETEVTNTGAMRLYEKLGFMRSKKLHRYYLSGNTAYRLVLLLKSQVGKEEGQGMVRQDGAVAS